MPHFMLTDEQWLKLKNILLDCGIYDKPNLRLTIEGILFKLKQGCTWRAVPFYFGNWNSIFRNFSNWCVENKLFAAFKIASLDCDLEWVFIDGSILSAHQHATGASQKSEVEIHKV